MADFPPYINAYGYIPKTLEAIKPVPVPPKFTQDFLETKLDIKSKSARPVIAFLKRIGFLSESSIPTERYKAFRNPNLSSRMIAEGIRDGYAELYKYHEYLHDLSESELEGIVLQASNAEKGQTTNAVVKSFMLLNSMADFNSEEKIEGNSVDITDQDKAANIPAVGGGFDNRNSSNQPKMNLSYTINLNLPETTNAEVFDAIFQSLNRNILKEND